MTSRHLDVLLKAGFSKNEAAIYAALLAHGECSAPQIVRHSKVFSRNVYDALNRLLEKGVVIEIIQGGANRYQAVDPQKLLEIVEEDRQVLLAALPQMNQLYKIVPEQKDTLVYSGLEGWKTLLRDVIRLGEDLRVLGGRNFWEERRLRTFLPWFEKEARGNSIALYQLMPSEEKDGSGAALAKLGIKARFLPRGCSTAASLAVFGDHTTFIASPETSSGDSSFTVAIHEKLAESFRTWFDFMWRSLPDDA